MLRAIAETAALPRAAIVQRGRRLEYFTIVWNLLEGLIAVAAGALAGSISLIGFGLDSFIEVASGAALLWRMAVDADARRREWHEKRAQQAVGICFLALAAFLAYQSAADLWLRRAPLHSLPGTEISAPRLFR
jgi:divalent metal cation (Fe/Co/Zn/Cd) transporter